MPPEPKVLWGQLLIGIFQKHQSPIFLLLISLLPATLDNDIPATYKNQIFEEITTLTSWCTVQANFFEFGLT